MDEQKLQIKEEQKKNRLDYKLIIDTIKKGSLVLDLGCGTGTLLKMLKKKGIDGRGIELKQDRVRKCIEAGLSVLHSDLDEGLKYYADKSFDYVIFNQTIQAVKNSFLVLKEALRVGKKVIVSFPNFAHYTTRISFFFGGRAPKSRALPYEWYDTPNLRVLTTKDFRELCKNNKIRIIKEYNYVSRNGHGNLVWFLPNFFATNSLFLIDG